MPEWKRIAILKETWLLINANRKDTSFGNFIHEAVTENLKLKTKVNDLEIENVKLKAQLPSNAESGAISSTSGAVVPDSALHLSFKQQQKLQYLKEEQRIKAQNKRSSGSYRGTKIDMGGNECVSDSYYYRAE